MATLRWGATTDVGRVRTSNEDAYVAKPGLFVVADGMGGHLAGEVASELAVATLDQRLGSATPSEATVDALSSAVQQANDAIFNESQSDATRLGMGTTVTAIVVIRSADQDDDAAELFAIANVGDSRAYAFRGDRLVQLSVDHSYVQELVASGQIEPEEARTHPNRNIVTKALGIELGVEPDVWTLPIVAGDRLLLCSDGLVDEVADAAIASIMRTVDEPQDAAEELVAAANVNGGRDNVTVVVIDVIAVEPTEASKKQTAIASGASAPMTAADRFGPVPRRVSAALQPSGSIAVDAEAGIDVYAELDERERVGTSDRARSAGRDDTVGIARSGPKTVATDSKARTAPQATKQATKTGDAAKRAGASNNGETSATATSRPVDHSGSIPIPRLVKDASKPIPRPKRRKISVASVLFATAVLAVFVAAFAFTAAQARSGYFVAFRGEEIYVFKGKPDGMLWFDPTVAVDTQKRRSDITPDQIPAIEAKPTFENVASALQYVTLLTNQTKPVTTALATTTPQTTPQTTAASLTTAPPTTVIGG